MKLIRNQFDRLVGVVLAFIIGSIVVTNVTKMVNPITSLGRSKRKDYTFLLLAILLAIIWMGSKL
jgi:hypothetical protein